MGWSITPLLGSLPSQLSILFPWSRLAPELVLDFLARTTTVSFLADGKPKRHYKMGRAKYIGKRLTSYKTYHPEEHAIRLHACICIPLSTPLAKWSKYDDATHLFKETTLNTGSLVVLFETMCKNNLIAWPWPQTVQIRNTE